MGTTKTELNFKDLTGFRALPVEMSFVKMISLMPNSINKISKFITDMLILFYMFVGGIQTYSIMLGWMESFENKDFFKASNSIVYTVLYIDLIQKYTLMRFNTSAIEEIGNWAKKVNARPGKHDTKLITFIKLINKFHFLGAHFMAAFWAFYPLVTGKALLPLKYPFLKEMFSMISFPMQLILYTGFSIIISYGAALFLYNIALFCSEIYRLADDWGNLSYDNKQPRLYRQQIKLLVARHVELLKILRCIKKLHENAFGFQIIISMTIIFTGTFGIVMLGNDAIKLIIITTPFLILTVGEFYIMCWIGVEITDGFLSFHHKVYLTNWYEAPVNDRLSLHLVMDFSKKPIILTGAKIYTASLDTFGSVMKETFSLYTVIKAIMI